jgi:hypothetical protein
MTDCVLAAIRVLDRRGYLLGFRLILFRMTQQDTVASLPDELPIFCSSRCAMTFSSGPRIDSNSCTAIGIAASRFRSWLVRECDTSNKLLKREFQDFQIAPADQILQILIGYLTRQHGTAVMGCPHQACDRKNKRQLSGSLRLS